MVGRTLADGSIRVLAVTLTSTAWMPKGFFLRLLFLRAVRTSFLCGNCRAKDSEEVNAQMLKLFERGSAWTQILKAASLDFSCSFWGRGVIIVSLRRHLDK